MTRYRNIVSHIVFSLQLILLMSVFFHDQLVLPDWLASFGSFHLVLLHFPIVLLALVFLLIFLPKAWREDEQVATGIDMLWLHASGFAAITAIFGLFLSLEGGYDADRLDRHMWMGAITSVVSYAIWSVYKLPFFPNIMTKISVLACSVTLIWGSHEGGTLTHGEGFLSFSKGKVEEKVEQVPDLDSLAIFTAAVEPILQSKCQSCHNEQKAKGEFIMTSPEKLIKGGKEGAPWVAGMPDSSRLIQRLLLGMEDEKHMPPKGKAQLTTKEIELLHRWIGAGADFSKKISDYPEQDSFRIIAASFYQLPKKEKRYEKSYGFAFADPDMVRSLNTPFRVVSLIDKRSPALQISFYVASEYNADMLSACSPVAEQTVRLNLSGMPAGDEASKDLAAYINLERLNLNGTKVTGKTLAQLRDLPSLQTLSLANTEVGLKDLESMAPFRSVKHIYLWRSKVSTAEAASLAKKYPGVQFIMGEQTDINERLVLTPPTLKQLSKTVFKKGEGAMLKHPMQGVKIRYTVDGTDPDTLLSTVFQAPIPVNGPMEIRAVAVMDGWYASKVSVFSVFARGILPSNAMLHSVADSRYRAQGSASLTDGQKGESNNSLVNWLGFREAPFVASFQFAGTDSIHKVICSMADNNGSYIMPPKSIAVWAGNDSTTMVSVGRMAPQQPEKYGPVRNKTYTVDIKPGKYKYVRVQADPVSSLPKWHRGKGDKGWIFVDEVFFE